MATVEAAITFTTSASDGVTSEDLSSLAMSITLVEVREPLYIVLTEANGI